MSQKSSAPVAREPTVTKAPAERVVRDIRRATRAPAEAPRPDLPGAAH